MPTSWFPSGLLEAVAESALVTKLASDRGPGACWTTENAEDPALSGSARMFYPVADGAPPHTGDTSGQYVRKQSQGR